MEKYTPAKWGTYKNFKKEEFDCRHTGKNEMKHETMLLLQQLRELYDKPITIVSGYRDRLHPSEAMKALPGTHNMGLACDIRVRGSDAHRLLKFAMALNFSGIGISQKGKHRFIHLDIATKDEVPLRPAVWSY